MLPLVAVLGSQPAVARADAIAECAKNEKYLAHKEAGLEYFRFGAYFLALTELLAAQLRCPADHALLAKSGRCYQLLGQLESASAVYRQYVRQADSSTPEYRDVVRWLSQLWDGTTPQPALRTSSGWPEASADDFAFADEERRRTNARAQKAAAGAFVTFGGIALLSSIGWLASPRHDVQSSYTCSTGFSHGEPCLTWDNNKNAWPIFGVSIAVLGTGSIWLASRPWARRGKQ